MPTFPNRRTYIDEVDGIQLGTPIDNAEFQELQKRGEQYVHNQFGHLHYAEGYISLPTFISPSERRITLEIRNPLQPFRCYTVDAGYWSQTTEKSIDYNALPNGTAVNRYDYLYIEIFKIIATGEADFRLNIYQNNNSPNVNTTPDVTTSSRNVSTEENHVILPLLKTLRYQTVGTPEVWGYGEDDHSFIGVASKMNISAVNSNSLVANLNSQYLGGYDSSSFLAIAKQNLINQIYEIIGDFELVKGLWLFDNENLEETSLLDRSLYANNASTSTYIRRLSPEKKGLAYTLNFNDDSKYFTIPDNNNYSFGDGTSDSPFSLVVLANPDNLSNNQSLLTKYDETAGSVKKEWLFGFDSGNFTIALSDKLENSSLQAIQAVSDYTNGYHTWIGTYDGSGTKEGLGLYYDGVDQAPTLGGTDPQNYTCMKNTAANVGNYVLNSTSQPVSICVAQYAFVMIAALRLSQDQITDINALLRTYVADIEVFSKSINTVKNKGSQRLTGNLTCVKNNTLSDDLYASSNLISFSASSSSYPSVSLWIKDVSAVALYLNSLGELKARSDTGKDTNIVQFHGVLSSAPASYHAGDTYKNSGDNKYYIYNGTGWDALT